MWALLTQVLQVRHQRRRVKSSSSRRVKWWAITKRPDLDARSPSADGYFLQDRRFGFERRSDGQLKITGRLKELFKTSKGKYVAPAPIENRLNAHPMIELSLVSGSGSDAQPYALVVLAEQLAIRVAATKTVRTQVQHRTRAMLFDEVNRQIGRP
jgi:acyl-coenzyme A synthetase/AMP-(fatty) acid ligase